MMLECVRVFVQPWHNMAHMTHSVTRVMASWHFGSPDKWAQSLCVRGVARAIRPAGAHGACVLDACVAARARQAECDCNTITKNAVATGPTQGASRSESKVMCAQQTLETAGKPIP